METEQQIQKGYKSLLESVKKDLEGDKATYVIDGNGLMVVTESNEKRCFQNYGEKFNWIIARAKHYSEKTGIAWEEILKGWEEQRGYWYQNFYQESNQPEIKSENVIIVESKEDFWNKFPSKKFICPYCKGVSTDPYECNSGEIVELLNGKKKVKEKCNWKVYGLFGSMGDGVHVFVKSDLRLLEIFKPLELNNGKNGIPPNLKRIGYPKNTII